MHLLGHLLEVRLGAGRQHDMRTGLGQSDGDAPPDAEPRPGDDGDAVVDAEPIEDHPRLRWSPRSARPATSGMSR